MPRIHRRYRFNDTYIAGKPDVHRTTRQKGKAVKDSAFAFDRPFGDILVCMAVCNKASISTHDNEHETKKLETVKILGNPSEAAMLRYVVEVADAELMRAQYEIIYEVPFNSTRKYHLVIVKDMLEKNDTPTQANYILLMKGIHTNSYSLHKSVLSGAPEIITKRCDKYAADAGAEYKMDAAYMESFDAAYEHFGTQAWQTCVFDVRCVQI